MANLFEGFASISMILFIIGLIKPSWVIRWGKEENKNRKEVSKYYLGASIFFGFMNSLFIEMNFNNSKFLNYILISFFFIVYATSFIVLLGGLIKPSWVIRWGEEENKTRKNLLKYYGPIFLISVFTVAMLLVLGSSVLLSIITAIGAFYLIYKTYETIYNKYIERELNPDNTKSTSSFNKYKARDKNAEVEKQSYRMEREEAKKIEERNNQINELFDIVFQHKYLENKLEEFIVNNTKRYDNGEYDEKTNDNSLTLFLEYITNRIESDIIHKEEEVDDTLKEAWSNYNSLNLSVTDLESYINSKKEEIYTNEMKSILKIKDEDELENKIQKYVAIFGQSSLETFNLRVFSMLLNIDSVGLSVKVKREYDRERREYELRKMEDTLFGSSVNKRDLKYIDSLSGFQFEDYLEDLFIEFGYRAKDLPYSNDYGADLIISKGLEDIVIQAKKYNSSNVGVQAVQEVIAAKSHYKTDIAMVITNSYYTANALEAARISEVIMIDRDDLEKILKEGRSYFNSLIK